MFNKKFFIVSLIAVLVVGIVAVAIPTTPVFASATQDVVLDRGGRGNGADVPQGTGNGNTTNSGNQATSPNGTGLYYNYQPLTDVEIANLQEAILEEYGALNLYQSVIDQFGAVSPFTEIVLSEQQHVNTLIMQAQKYGVEVPPNPGLASDGSFASLEEACQAGVQAEIADAALYDELMAATTNTALLRVYANLQSASLNSHLPAFEQCNCY